MIVKKIIIWNVLISLLVVIEFSLDCFAQEKPLLYLDAQIGSVDISKDGQHLLITTSNDLDLDGASDRNTVHLLDSNTGEILRTYRLPQKQFHRFASVGGAILSPDGRMVLSGGSNFQGKIWDAKTGDFLYDLSTLNRFIEYGKSKASSLETVGYTIHSPHVNNSGWIVSMGFNSDGSQFFTIDSREDMQIWDAKTYQELHRFNVSLMGTGNEKTWRFLSDDRRLFVNDGYYSYILDSVTGKILQDFVGFSGHLSPDEKTFISYFSHVKEIIEKGDDPYAIYPSPKDKNQYLRFLDVNTKEKVREDILLGDEHFMRGPLALSPDGNTIAIGGYRRLTADGSSALRGETSSLLVSLHSSKVLKEIPVFECEKTDRYRAGGGILNYQDKEGEWKKFDNRDWSNWVKIVRFFPDGKRLLIVDKSGLQIWDISEIASETVN